MRVPREERVIEQGAKLILKKLEDAYEISEEYEQYIKYKDMANFKMGINSIEAATSDFLARDEKLRNTGIYHFDSLLTFMLLTLLN